MSSEKKDVRETSETEQDSPKEEAGKRAEDSRDKLCADIKEIAHEKKEWGEIAERIRQPAEDIQSLCTGDLVFPLRNKKLEEAEQTVPAEGGEKAAPQTACAVHYPKTEVSQNKESADLKDFPGEVEQMFYEAFSGAVYKGKPVVDMFGFTEKEEQALKEWTNTKRNFMKALSGDHDFVSRTIGKIGANTYDTTRNNSTALMLACTFGNLSIVSVLLVSGARVNDTNLLGRTALMEAAECGHLDLVKLLVKHGADVNMRDSSCDTAYGLAYKKEHWEVVKYLDFVMSAKEKALKKSESAKSEEDRGEEESDVATRHQGVTEKS